ncbi:hypothetical protein QWZ04_11350 [Vibrio tapetis subsp. quintayensis]|uniref:hypothetical protein n=1 Tax=Vibrio tapetis TaxID=52443 RepID=UPI0025B53022|nr:hypothetical protein [Vibrio tapetis]MDN3680916.1 hypothetical protein [Vibrio tapetis subsp. quintayensis]
MRYVSFLFFVLLVGCQTTSAPNNTPIGYLGFANQHSWAVKFNDCTVYDQQGALPYLWLNRTLTTISCYQVQSSDLSSFDTPQIALYDEPHFDAQVTNVDTLEELFISESGWGTFPFVYQALPSNWIQLKEGWIHLSSNDLNVVQLHQGSQNDTAKAKHDEYYLNH